MPWIALCRRTNPPKLRYIEAKLDELEIPYRRHGESWHAPILQVESAHYEAASDILMQMVEVDGVQVMLDEIPDNHPMFKEF